MIVGVDYVGIATVISAVGAAVASVLAAVNNSRINRVHNQVKTSNGHTLGEQVDTIADATATPTEEHDTKG